MLLKKIFIFITGCLFLFGVWLFIENYNFLRNAEYVFGTVVENKTIYDDEDESVNYSPVLHYVTQSGRTVSLETDFSSSNILYDVGEQVTVAYDPEDPENGRVAEFFIMFFPVSVVFFIFFIFSLIIIILSSSLFHFDKKKLEELKAQGIHVRGKVINISMNKNVTFNNRHPYYLIVGGTDPVTQQKKEWKSKNIWKDPTEFVSLGKDTEIYIDPQNPKRYIIDITFFPPDYLKVW